MSDTRVFSNTVIRDLIIKTEEVYCVVFEKGNRHEGMSKLRLPEVHTKASAHYDARTRGPMQGHCADPPRGRLCVRLAGWGVPHAAGPLVLHT